MRKRLLFVLLFVSFGLAAMWGQEVSEKEAQVRAQKFVNSHYGRKGGGSELKSLGQVNGLYVFNMNDKGGFVIVSNDERATDILGYSESGQFDPDNMPDNMRAWLQGYADEIAWAQKNIKEVTDANPNVKTRAQVGTHSTKTIVPLITTKWDQDYPYNAYCNFNNMQCATGCVATAMAQVMYYTEMKAGNNSTTTTAQIPAYTTSTNHFNIGYVPVNSVINWSQMTSDYNSSYTSEQATAVAKLMLYCGCSVMMDYGPESSSNTKNVATALKSYFNYDNETTKFVSRGCYTNANWIDLIYHELEEGRPVVYGGQSNGGGHEFVCDGYKYDNETDMFHINWGWGGTSDGYFVLSSLNPYEQGTGGSSSNDGFHFGQNAVVGIKKTGAQGAVLNVSINNYKLTINSINISPNKIALGESVNVTLNVTNSGEDDYDGDLMLAKDNFIFWGESFVIPAGTTNQDYVIRYTPTNAGTETLQCAFTNNDFTNNDDEFDDPDYTVTLNIVDQTPIDLTASNITPTTATIGWTNVGAATKWNMRSRTTNITINDFNDLETFDNNGVWKLVRFGNSQNTLKISPNGGINNSKCLISPSYENGTDLDPYGGLRTPLIKLNGSFSFYAWGEGEKFWIFLSLNGSNYTSITDIISTTNVQTLYSFDLSQYVGQYADQSGYIAIIHCNSSGHTSDSYLYIDNVSITQPVGEWTKTNNITSPYILNGLSPDTGYEVQVQAVINDGGKWSAPVIFKSKASTDPLELENGNNNVGLIEGWNTYTTTVTLKDRTLYKDGDWNTLCLPFSLDATQLAASPLAGADIRALESGSLEEGVLTLNFTPAAPEQGAITEIVAGTPYIIKWASGDNLVNPVFEGVTIDKTMHDVTSSDGKVTFKGTYESQTFNTENTSILFVGGNNKLYYPAAGASIGAQRAYFQIGSGNSSIRAFNLNFGDDDVTGISNASIMNDTVNWYDLSGSKLNGKPVKKGVYVQNGKKVVIK